MNAARRPASGRARRPAPPCPEKGCGRRAAVLKAWPPLYELLARAHPRNVRPWAPNSARRGAGRHRAPRSRWKTRRRSSTCRRPSRSASNIGPPRQAGNPWPFTSMTSMSGAVVSHTVSSKQSPSRTDWSSGALADEIAAVSAVGRIRLRSRDSSRTEGREQVAASEKRGGHDGRSRVVRMLTHLVGPIHSGTLASAMMLRIACTRSGRWHPLRRGVLLSEAGNRTSESGTLA